MTTGNKYSLWLKPSGALHQLSAGLIRKLSQQWVTPVFEPHVTLLGGMEGAEAELLLKTSELASDLEPFTLQLREVAWLDEYFRCLFLRAEVTPSLLEAHHKACRRFGHRDFPVFMPHLSLVYGNLPPGSKQKIVEEIGSVFSWQFEVQRVYLYSAAGDPEQWSQAGEFMLGSNTKDVSVT